MVHLNPHLSVLPDLHSAGLGHLYFDNNQFSVCISGTSVALHHRSRTDAHSTTMDLQACQPNQTVPILTYDNKLEVFSLSSAIRPWCFGTDKSGSLFVGSFSEAPDAHVDWPAARCVHFSPHVQRTVRIDFSVISSSSHSESSVATDIQRCLGFTELLYPANNQEHVFTMLTGMGRRRRDIEFWLDFCGVVLPTVHVWDYSNYYNDDIRSPLSYISRCNVRHVTGMDLGAAGGESVAAPGRVVCVEEFLEQLLLSRRTGNGDVAGVTFLSAVTGPPSSNGNDDLVLWQREHTNEILGVVGAFVETGFAELNVRNLWSSTTGQNDDILLDSIRIALDQQSIQSTSDEWSQGIDTLWSLAESCYGHNQESPSMQQRLCWSRFPMLLAHELNYRMGLKNGLSNHICVIDCQDDAIYWQRQELARFLRRVSVSAVEHGLTHFRQYSMGCNSRNTMSRFLSEFCSQIESERVTSSVGQLLLLSKDLFQLPHPLIGNGVNIDDNSGIRDFEIAPLKHNIFYRTFLSQSPENYSRKYAAGAYDLPFSFTAGRYSADDSHLENEIISIKNSEGKIYVLCFVESDMDLLQARIIIQKWREGCDGCRFHAVFTVYLVPPCAQKTLRSYTSGCTLR